MRVRERERHPTSVSTNLATFSSPLPRLFSQPWPTPPTADDVIADGCITEAELLDAAEDRGIVLTDQEVQAFLASEGACVPQDAQAFLQGYLDSLDLSEEGRKRKDSGNVF